MWAARFNDSNIQAKKMSDWDCTPKGITSFIGFVYIITNKINGKYYVGQKKFWFKRKLKPLKGKTQFRHKTVESDWREYYGSSKILLADIKKYGKENFFRHMICVCKSKAFMNYHETKEQFVRDVLFDPLSYNNMVNCRISRNQLPL